MDYYSHSRRKRKEQFRNEMMIFGAFVFFYPMIISVYMGWPPLIGIAGYLLTKYQHKRAYFILLLAYLIHVDLNLALPLFLSLITIYLVQFLVFTQFRRFFMNKYYLPIFFVLFTDMAYYLVLLVYDFVFNTTSITYNYWLIYYVIIDLMFIGWYRMNNEQ
ncbi:MAG: hypothetical protein IE881_05110 [Epsilonproteobacteria bacterium]|nr:hypothetical protein [Campylobacterota bacterium]